MPITDGQSRWTRSVAADAARGDAQLVAHVDAQVGGQLGADQDVGAQ
jgi:hypothetical protein